MPQLSTIISAGTTVGVAWSWWAPSQREGRMEQGQVYLPDTVMENLWAKNQLVTIDTSKFKNV